MQVGNLDKRAAIGLLAIALMGGYLIVQNVGSSSSAAKTPVGGAQTIPLAEARLKHLRELASTVPAKQELANKAKAELADREKGLLTADSEQSAQAQLLDITQRIARANQIDVRGMQQFGDKLLSPDYGEVSATVQFSCGIEQLVNFLSAIGTQSQILATNDIQIRGGTDPKKNLQVRMAVTAVVPSKLLPKKGKTTL